MLAQVGYIHKAQKGNKQRCFTEEEIEASNLAVSCVRELGG